MYISLSVTILVALSVSVHGSGYFPSIGGPWGRYTTTTPAPGSGEGFNLPVTEAPPSVTFVPRPKPVTPGPNLDSNNNVDGQNQNENTMQNFLIVTDPMTGERFLVPRQNFWNRFGNGASNQPSRRQPGQGSNYENIQLQQPGYGTQEEGLNKNAGEDQEDFTRTQSRTKRSADAEELTSEELKMNKDDFEEPRHIDMLADDNAEEKIVGDDKLLSENRNIEASSGESSEIPRPKLDNLNVIDSREEEEVPRMAFKSSADLFQIFFPSFKFDQGKKMLYTYTQYRHYPAERSTTTTTPTPTTMSTTTPIPTTASVEQEQPERTTIAELEENTEIPQITTEIPHEEVSPSLS